MKKLSKNSPGVGRWMKKLKERREARYVEGDEMIVPYAALRKPAKKKRKPK